MSISNVSTVPPHPTTTRGQSAKLSISPKGDRLVYCNGRSVIVRPVPGTLVETSAGPAAASTIIYSQHPQPVTVARISPSGAYVASADQSGLVRIWDIIGTEQILKAEYRPFAGVIRDLAWDSESKRIAVVGEGKERFGHFFLADTGSSCGEVTGHGKIINSVALKPTRPFKAVTASDDNNLVFFSGVPYKYTSTLSNHTRFAQSVAYSSDGTHFASVASDSKVNIYDGTSGELKHSVQSSAAGGSQFDVAFTQDSKHLVTVGADGTARLWTLEGKSTAEWDLKAGHANAGDHLVGVTLTGQVGIALNLVGELILFDLAKTGEIKARYLNPTKGITAGVRISQQEYLLASWDGNVYRYQAAAGTQEWTVTTVQGYKAGGPVVSGLAADDQGTAYAVGMDDTLRKIRDGKTESFTARLPSALKGISASPKGDVYVATADTLLSLPAGASDLAKTKLSSDNASGVAVSSSGHLVAIGFEDGKVRVYASGGDAAAKYTLEKNRSQVTSLSFSPSGDLLAAGDSNGRIMVYNTSDGSLKLNQWVFHTSRITSLHWTQDGSRLVSGSLDTHLYIWSVERPMKRIEGKNLHAGGVAFASWLDDAAAVVTAGNDGAFKVWKTQ